MTLPNASLSGAPLLDFARALDFAAHKHIDQRRKGVRAEPYVNHLSEVALLAAEATAGKDPVVVIAALLHDTLEDTDASYEEIEQLFGAEVVQVVAETTDDKRMSKAERKQHQRQDRQMREEDRVKPRDQHDQPTQRRESRAQPHRSCRRHFLPYSQSPVAPDDPVAKDVRGEAAGPPRLLTSIREASRARNRFVAASRSSNCDNLLARCWPA